MAFECTFFSNTIVIGDWRNLGDNNNLSNPSRFGVLYNRIDYKKLCCSYKRKLSFSLCYFVPALYSKNYLYFAICASGKTYKKSIKLGIQNICEKQVRPF